MSDRLDNLEEIIPYVCDKHSAFTDVFVKAWAEVAEKKPSKISSPSDIAPHLDHFAFNDTESFIVVTLNGAHEVIKVREISKGILNRAIIHPREVFRPALLDNCASIVVAHNHPSGNLQPSKEDKDITFRLKEAGELLGIEVLDHIIIGSTGYYSFLEDGEL